MAGCAQFIRDLWARNVSFTINQNQVCRTFLVPKPQMASDTYFLYHLYQYGVWGCFTGCLIILTFMSKFLFWVIGFKVDYSIVVINLVKIYCAGGITSFDLTWQSCRIFFLSVLLHSFLLVTYYSARLSSSLAVIRYSRQINTLQDVVDANLPIIEFTDLKEDLTVINSSLFHQLDQLYTNNVKPGDSPALAIRTFENSYVTGLNQVTDSRKLTGYKALKECLFNNYIGFPLQKNSPFKNRFDAVAKRILEGGIMSKWVRDVIWSNRKEQDKFFSTEILGVGYARITPTRFSGALQTLMLGYFVSSLVFFFEFLLGKIEKPRK